MATKKEAAAKAAPKQQEITEATTGIAYADLYAKAVQLEQALKSANGKLSAVANILSL